jgi:hypothetical protein
MTEKGKTVKKKRRAGTASAPYCFRCEWDTPDAAALQALERGDASEEQQQRALKWIVNNAAGTYELAWEPDNERASSFESGRRYVGLEIVKLLKLNLAVFRSKQHE